MKSDHHGRVGSSCAQRCPHRQINIPPFEAMLTDRRVVRTRDPDGQGGRQRSSDVPEPITTPQPPWTNRPGQAGNGNGVELWLPATPPRRSAIEAANTGRVAVRLKFGMPGMT